MIRSYRYLLRPNKQQTSTLNFLLWQARIVYNTALEQRIKIYQETGKTIWSMDQWPYYRELRKASPNTIGQLNAYSMNQVLRRLDKAYQNFFRGLKTDHKWGFPKFKNEREFNCLEYGYGNGCKLRMESRDRICFYIQNIGEIRLCYHRPIPEGSIIKRVAIKRVKDRWYIFTILDMPCLVPEFRPPYVIGVDVGLKTLLAFSDGTLVENPHWLRQNRSALRVAHRKASRRKKGSHRRKRAYQQLSRLYGKIANRRHDYMHKITQQLVEKFTLIAIEDLPMAFMNQNKHLASASNDAGLSEFRRLLEYKAEAAGVQVIAVSPYNTSQRCSGCGELVPKDLDTRIHTCLHCGLVLDRDVNAARNILQAAIAQVNTQ